MHRIQIFLLVVLSLLVLTSVAGWDIRDAAAGGDIVVNETDISGNAFSSAEGAVGVNIAAGEDNLQVNARAIAIGLDGDFVFPFISVHQSTNSESTTEGASYSSNNIGGGAFAGSSGIISVNQAAGSGSAQANLVSIGFGAPVSNQELHVSYGQADDGPQGFNGGGFESVINGDAFSGSQGLIQVNQSAGVANRVINKIAIGFTVTNID